MNIDIKNYEKLNLDYLQILNSKEYVIGKKKTNNKNINLKKIIFKINRKMHLGKIKSCEKKYNFTEEDILKLDKADLKNKKVVIYSAIIGRYDNILEPMYEPDNVDYIMFTDQNLESKIWNVKNIPEKISKLNNPILINRYIKFHPYELFSEQEYDYSIYVDGNILIVSDLTSMINLIDKDYGIGMHKHYSRNCTYDEALTCIYNKKGNAKAIRKMINEYKEENFPKQYGLLEAPIIVSDLKNEISLKLQNEIYDKLISTETYRDQLCIPYVLWKNNIQIEKIGTLGLNIHLNPKIRSVSHK